MVVDPEVEQARALDQLARQPDVLPARRRVPARVVVEKNDRRRRLEDGRLEDLARMHEARRERAHGDHPVAQETVLGVEQGHAEHLAREVFHERAERGVDGGGAREHDARARRPRAKPARELEGGHEPGGLDRPDALDLGELRHVASGDAGE